MSVADTDAANGEIADVDAESEEEGSNRDDTSGTANDVDKVGTLPFLEGTADLPESR